MKKFKHILFILPFIYTFCFANSNVRSAYAIGIFDENGNGENIQHVRKTKNDYNGTCYSKIVVFGNLNQSKAKVRIGNSIGHFVSSKAVHNKNKRVIGQEITFKHYGITKGYFEVRVDNKLYDTKAFIR